MLEFTHFYDIVFLCIKIDGKSQIVVLIKYVVYAFWLCRAALTYVG